jgi:hypothetical protein
MSIYTSKGMDLLEYPIEYRRPMEEEKLLILSVISIILILIVFAMNLRGGRARPFQTMPPSARH